ncbi:NUDIX hydrolase [Streptomyces sp. NPDC087440]|uniref:NUDIX hydrolase n=1 Tax=Streptomyces sp. NPDC087440 TaxID=3365790 RepID=UPI00381DD3A6
MDLRLAAYAVCIEDGRLLLAHAVKPDGEQVWTLPGGQVEGGEDPVDAVVREVAEETGLDAEVVRILGVDSRTVPAAERHVAGRPALHNVGVFYRVRITGGRMRPEPNGETAESVWTPLADVPALRRSSLVDVGLALERDAPASGHVPPVPLGGLVEH